MSDGAALVDAAGYPLQSDALATLAALALCYLLVELLPDILVLQILALVLKLVIWASAYRYALEVLTASGQGRATPPQGGMLTDVGIARRHAWMQALVILGLLVAGALLGPDWGLLLLLMAALIMPGALLAMCAAQNMLAAINPLAWIAVLRIVGPRYLLLAAGVSVTLLIQLLGAPWFDAVPFGGLLFFACVFYTLIASFRLVGTTLHRHAAELGHEQVSAAVRPVLIRERESLGVAREAAEAITIADPAQRALALAPIIRRGGASAALQRDYRLCLRQSGQLDLLREHAGVRVCELVAMSQPQAALALASEAMADHADFSLADAEPTARVSESAAASGQLRLGAALCRNYFERFPKRRDAFPLACRAAVLLADRLGDAAAARQLLLDSRAALGERPESAEIDRMLRRLDAGVTLGSAGAAPAEPAAP